MEFQMRGIQPAQVATISGLARSATSTVLAPKGRATLEFLGMVAAPTASRVSMAQIVTESVLASLVPARAFPISLLEENVRHAIPNGFLESIVIPAPVDARVRSVT